MNIIWLGHASFRIEIEDAALLIDPWLDGNPSFPQSRRSDALTGATHVLLTHGHGDHTANAAEILKETGAVLVGIPEICALLGGDGILFNTNPGSEFSPIGADQMREAANPGNFVAKPPTFGTSMGSANKAN